MSLFISALLCSFHHQPLNVSHCDEEINLCATDRGSSSRKYCWDYNDIHSLVNKITFVYLPLIIYTQCISKWSPYLLITSSRIYISLIIYLLSALALTFACNNCGKMYGKHLPHQIPTKTSVLYGILFSYLNFSACIVILENSELMDYWTWTLWYKQEGSQHPKLLQYGRH
jgi:hypothetical protein